MVRLVACAGAVGAARAEGCEIRLIYEGSSSRPGVVAARRLSSYGGLVVKTWAVDLGISAGVEGSGWGGGGSGGCATRGQTHMRGLGTAGPGFVVRARCLRSSVAARAVVHASAVGAPARGGQVAPAASSAECRGGGCWTRWLFCASGLGAACVRGSPAGMDAGGTLRTGAGEWLGS